MVAAMLLPMLASAAAVAATPPSSLQVPREAASPEEGPPAASGDGEWLVARLHGAYLLKGDSDGTGTLQMRLDRKRLRLCYTLTTRFIGIATMRGKLHHLYGMQEGPTILDLDVTGAGNTTCTFVMPAEADELLREPGNFYVTVRNRQFPDGALRGRLGKG